MLGCRCKNTDMINGVWEKMDIFKELREWNVLWILNKRIRQRGHVRNVKRGHGKNEEVTFDSRKELCYKPSKPAGDHHKRVLSAAD